MSIDSSIIPAMAISDILVWDGVPPRYNVGDKLDCSGLVYDDGSYPLSYNIRDGILYNDKVGVSFENYVGVEDSIDTTEQNNLNHTKSNIRKIKPDINSKLKRV